MIYYKKKDHSHFIKQKYLKLVDVLFVIEIKEGMKTCLTVAGKVFIRPLTSYAAGGVPSTNLFPSHCPNHSHSLPSLRYFT